MMPARTASKKDAILAGRLTASRTCRGAFRYLAAKFGLYPSLRAMFKTRSFVEGFMPPRECRARSTVPFDNPKALAMSLIPTGRGLVGVWWRPVIPRDRVFATMGRPRVCTFLISQEAETRSCVDCNI